MIERSQAHDHRLPSAASEPSEAPSGEGCGKRLFALECFGYLLECSRDAVALLDASGMLFYANVRFSTLQAELAPGNLNIQSRPLLLPALRGLRSGLEQGRRAGGQVAGQPVESTIEVLLASTRRRLNASARVISCATAQGGAQDVTMLVLHDADSETKERLRAFRARYALTFMECRVLELFLSGKDLRAISELLHVSIHTARAHMKALLAKTGCGRQPELACLLNGTPGGGFQMTI